MSSHKSPPLKARTRNWEELMEDEDIGLPAFEKLRHHMADKDESDKKPAHRNRQSSHRTRSD